MSLSDRLAQEKQQLIELCGNSYVLDPDFGNLQDTKDRVRRTYSTVYSITTQQHSTCYHLNLLQFYFKMIMYLFVSSLCMTVPSLC